MEMYERLEQLLSEKRDLFVLYEEETKSMLPVNPEDMEKVEAALGKRQELIEKIDAVDEKMNTLVQGTLAGPQLMAAVKNRCDYKSLDVKGRKLFDAGQELYTLMARIRDEEQRIQEQMMQIQGGLQEKMKLNNRSAKFAGYLKQMDQGAKGILYDKKR